MIALHCDNPDCDSWQREPYGDFLVLTGHDSRDHHFCGVDCVMMWAAAYGSPKELR